uniref:Xenotropic and polytropic retrovirus receptor 1 homolog n=1 Tax=Phallusia mammillata TaxID=59560 RepID=A0A6F9DXR3_9ASCI|nr:xenotropic and polytropic retrovirus receptor 1 homolog [Phallusia mammillata]
MKFGSNLQAHLTPEWRSQYIDYEVLKSMLYDCKENFPISNATNVQSDEMIKRHVAHWEEQFFAECDMQLTKVNTFFAEKLAEATRRFALLQSEVQAHKESLIQPTPSVSSTARLRRRVSQAVVFPLMKEKVSVKTLKDLKLAFTEFYLSLILLQNYQEMNFTGFRKILKKHDKMLETKTGGDWHKNYVETSPFHKDNLISEYILKTENLYINELENGDRSKAMKRLRVPPLTETRTYPKGTVFRVGLFLGMFIVMVVVFILAAILLPIDADPWLTVNLYRAGFIVFLFIACMGLNTWGWRSAGVNHVLIFEIDPRQHLSHQHLFEVSAMLSIVWSFSIILFLFGNLPALSSTLPAYLNPGLVYAAYLLFLFNPFPVLFHKARFWLLRRLWRLVACGFYPVEFADFWLADQLNSLANLFVDAEFIICFYGFDSDIWTGRIGETCGSYVYGIKAIVLCYPAYIRFVQCLRRFYDSRKWFPHLVNAGKYSTTFFKVTFSALFTLHSEQTGDKQSVYFFLWLASLFVNSCYTFAWDIKMDWGFLDSNAGENKFLREEIVYPYKALYYLAILEDFLIRFSWIATVSVNQTPVTENGKQILSNVLMVLEVLRRFIWNFFRLENEHLNNCGEFRAVRDISIAPLHADDLASLENMMDDISGADIILLKRRGGLAVPQPPRFCDISRRHSSSALLYVGDTSAGTSSEPQV